MSDNRKRSASGTVQRRAFLAVRAGADRVSRIAEELGITGAAASKALYYLRLRKLVQRAGGLKHARWTVVPGARPPADRRGKPAGSRNRARNLGRIWLAMMRKKHGPHWRPPVIADPTPLAHYWHLPQPQEQRHQ